MKNQKKSVSIYKFQRIAKNNNSVRVRGLYSASFYLALNMSLEAYELDGFIYMWVPCGKQSGDRLKTYFVRYKLDSYKAKKDCVVSGGRI